MTAQFMTQMDLARRFGVTDRTIREWLATPHVGLPAAVLIGRKRYFDRDEILAWEKSKLEAKEMAA